MVILYWVWTALICLQMRQIVESSYFHLGHCRAWDVKFANKSAIQRNLHQFWIAVKVSVPKSRDSPNDSPYSICLDTTEHAAFNILMFGCIQADREGGVHIMWLGGRL